MCLCACECAVAWWKLEAGNFGKLPPNFMQFSAYFDAGCSQAASLLLVVIGCCFVCRCVSVCVRPIRKRLGGGGGGPRGYNYKLS